MAPTTTAATEATATSDKKRAADEAAAAEAEKKTKTEAASSTEGAYLAMPVVPSIVSHDAEKHMAWVLEHIPTATKVGESFKNDKGLLMHAVVALTNKNGTQHVYFGDAKCLFGNEQEEHAKSSLAGPEDLCKGMQLHLNIDTAAEGQAAWAKATAGGGTVLLPFEAAFWGAMFGVLRDPFGFAWAFCSSLPPKEDGDAEDRANGGAPAEESTK